MNLQNITRSIVAAINPMTTCLLESSTGNVTLDDGARVPEYQSYSDIPCQIQPMSTSDLMKVDGLNMQGTFKAVYLNGHWQGVSRPRIKGQDKITIDNEVWLVHQVIEQWPDWVKVAVILQVK